LAFPLAPLHRKYLSDETGVIMKGKYIKLVMTVIVTGFFTTVCRKAQAATRPMSEIPAGIKDHPVYVPQSTTIGTVSINETAGGEAKVGIRLSTGILASFHPSFQPLRENSEVIYHLNQADPLTGTSETLSSGQEMQHIKLITIIKLR
jgi:hypothetical protein